VETITHPLFFFFSVSSKESGSMRRIGIGAIVFLSFLFVLTNSASATGITVCPSGCDYVTIQNAVGNASSGDIINVVAGSYQGDIIINKSLTLQGAGRTNTTILRNTSVNQVVLIQASNVTIRNFKIDGGGTAPYACNNIISLSTAGSPPYENIEITDSHLLHSKLSSVYLGGKAVIPENGTLVGRHYKINDNIIEYFGCDASCSDDSGGIGTFKTLDVEIKRNIIREANPDPTYLTYSVTGIYFMDYTGGIIEDNIISRVYGAIMINSNVEETYVDNNTISETLMGLSQTESFAKVHFTGNTISTKSDPLDSGYYQRGISLGGDGDTYNSCPNYEHEVDNLQHEVSGNIIIGDNTPNSLGIRVKAGMIDGDWGASGNVTNNVVSNYDTGLAIYGKGNSGGDRTSHVHVSFANNSIIGSNIYASTTYWLGSIQYVNAMNNWWGSTTPNISKFYGNLTYYPFCLNIGCSLNIENETAGFGGNTTDFSAIADWSNVTLVLDAGEGMIEWGDNINLTGSNLQFDNYVEISHRKISLNAPMMPELDHPATLTFKNAGYANINDLSIKRNGITCPSDICSNRRIEGNSVLVDVNQMSDYWLEDSVLGSMPSITGQLVVSLGFGIMGLFAVLTLIYASYAQNPETFIKMMVSIIIIVLAIVAVWQGIVI